MKFELTLNEEDYLINTLFWVSKSKRAKKTRNTALVMMIVLCLVISLNSYLGDSIAISVFFLLLAVTSIFLYPVYQRWFYKRHYLKHIKETYKNRFGKVCEIEFSENYLLTRDFSGEAKMNLHEIEHIYETAAYFFIKFNTGESLILPKDRIPSDQFSIVLADLLSRLHIDHVKELNWKWK